MVKFYAFLMPTPSWIDDKGQYNGYVGIIDPDNIVPLSIQGCWTRSVDVIEHPLDDLVSVHGGITWDRDNLDISYSVCPNIGIESSGYDIYPVTSCPYNLYNYRSIGFDTCHWCDSSKDWNYEAVKAEALQLLKQLQDVFKDKLEIS